MGFGKDNINTNMRKIKKKGQEEIVGFVVIVVLVAVVFVVILGLYMNQNHPATERESRDVEQFLGSAMEYTSNCEVGSRYFSLGELVRECYDDSECDSGEDGCGVLSRTLQEIIETNWKIGEDRPSKGYIFNSTYTSLGSYGEEVLFITKGNCTIGRIGAEYLSPAQPGSITSSLQICV